MTNLTVRNIPDEVMEKTMPGHISKEMQVSILTEVCGSWEDNRSTKIIIDDIYKSRSKGRKIKLP
jgi:plasmid stability protein